jgi:hypothetical protein
MDSPSNAQNGVGPDSSQTWDVPENSAHIHYMTQAEPIFVQKPLRREPEPSWSGSLWPLHNLPSNKTGSLLFHVQQEPISPSSGYSPALTPSHSGSTVLSDRPRGIFGGLQQASSLDETASSSYLVRRRGFSATFLTPSTSKSLNEDSSPDFPLDVTLGIGGGTAEHSGLLRGISGYSEWEWYFTSPEYLR